MFKVATGCHAAYEYPVKGPEANLDGISSLHGWRFRDMWFDVQYLNPGTITRNVYIVAVPRLKW